VRVCQCWRLLHGRLQGLPGSQFAVLLLVNMHALTSAGVAESQHAKVVLRKSADGCLGEETAMLIEERSCAVQAVDAFRLLHLPALEVQAVRFPFLIISLTFQLFQNVSGKKRSSSSCCCCCSIIRQHSILVASNPCSWLQTLPLSHRLSATVGAQGFLVTLFP
jgi:hypothetical protein